MRGIPLAAAIVAMLGCVGAEAADWRDDYAMYDHTQLMCELFGDCPPPIRGTAPKAAESLPGKGITFPLRRPVKAPSPPVYSSLAIPHLDDAIAQLDPIVVEGERLSRWYGDLSLSRIERILPCLGCRGTPKPLPAALGFGVDLVFAALRGFFQQPHPRGEPNDESLYLAHDGCAESGDIRCGARPQLP